MKLYHCFFFKGSHLKWIRLDFIDTWRKIQLSLASWREHEGCRMQKCQNFPGTMLRTSLSRVSFLFYNNTSLLVTSANTIFLSLSLPLSQNTTTHVYSRPGVSAVAASSKMWCLKFPLGEPLHLSKSRYWYILITNCYYQ